MPASNPAPPPPPPPPPPKRAPIPHQHALTSSHHLFQVRTRWIARALAHGHYLPSHLLSTLLENRRIPAQTLAIWVDVLAQRDAVYALERLGLLESGGEDRERVECPDWLFLAIPGLLRRREDAPYLASMLISPRRKELDLPNQGLLAARCIQFLLKVRHYVALRETVDWVCKPEQRQIMDSRAFARCLAALTSHRSRATDLSSPPSWVLHLLAQKLRTTMDAYKVPKTLATFWPLFDPALIPRQPKDAARLLLEMDQAGIVPGIELLHAVMKVYSAAGNAAGAEVFLKEIVAGKAREEVVEVSDGGDGKDSSGSKVVGAGQRDGSGDDVSEAVEASGAEGANDTEDAFDSPPLSARIAPVEILDEQRSYGVYDTTYLTSLSKTPKRAFEYFDDLRTTPRLSPSHPPLVDVATWSSLFTIIGRSDVPTSQILSVLRTLESSSNKLPSVKIYTAIMQSLLRRGDFAPILPIWHRLESSGVRPDSHLLDIVARAHISLGHPSHAHSFLRSLAYRPSLDPPPSPHDSRRPLLPHSVRLDTIALNSLLSGYNRSGAYLTTYNLFKSLSKDFEVDPDAATLSILLDTARHASAAAGRGYGPGLEQLSFTGFSTSRYGDDSWDGKQAWRVAEGIMWDLLERNWPDGVEGLDDPMGSDGLVGWLNSVRGRKGRGEKKEGDFAGTLALDPPLYPHIFPSPPVFRSFLQLLGYHSTPDRIPRVLAWMKYVGSVPEKNTLCLAMMYIGEGGPTDKSWARLRTWLGEWVGEQMVPTDGEIAFMRRGGTRKL